MKRLTRMGAVLLAVSLFFGVGFSASAADSAAPSSRTIREEDVLTGSAKALYDALAGKLRQTETSYVRVECPVPAEPVPEDVEKILSAIKDYLTDVVYWWDKQSGVAFSCTYDKEKGTADMYLAFDVIPDYRGSQMTTSDGVTYWKLNLSAAKNDFKEASRILRNRPQGTEAAVRYFADEICKLTDYDYDVILGEDYTKAFQLTSVFDGDPKTQSVCEGYSKAFKYLCDRSGIDCLLVEGVTIAGPHMWNMVWLDGEWWLVDVTNTDESYDTDPDRMILVGSGNEDYQLILYVPSKYADSERLTEKNRYTASSASAVPASGVKKTAGTASRVDTLTPDGKSVQSRVYVPAGAPDGMDLHVSISEAATLARFQKFYKNKMAVLRLMQEGDLGAEVEVATRASLVKGMDTQNLVFYSYEAGKNSFTRIQEPKYSVDKAGYLHFSTSAGGYVVIAEGEFKK